MLTTPQITDRPSSRSSQKQEKDELEKRAGSPDKGVGEKGGGRENSNGIMSDELNQPGEGHINHNIDKSDSEEDDDDQDEIPSRRSLRGAAPALLSSPSPATSYWASASRPSSPGIPDNASDASSVMPMTTHNVGTGKKKEKYNHLSYWKARKVTFYKNGDPYFPGIEFRFRPGRDVVSIESLLDKLSLRMDLPRGARFIFNMEGAQIMNLEDLEDGGSYVVSSFKSFKSTSYGKKAGGSWYASGSGVVAGSQSWSKPSPSRKQSMGEALELGNATSVPIMAASGKPNAGRVIRIINNADHTVQCRVLLNLRTSQPFEEVVEDLGQVLKINGAKRMYTVSGQEVRSFSQLRNEFSDVDTFYLGVGPLNSPFKRSRSRGAVVVDQTGAVRSERQRRARSKSRPRSLYAAETDIVKPSPSSDYTLLEVLKEEPIRITIKGMRRTFYPPLHHPIQDNSPPEKRLILNWVHGYRGIDSKRNLWVLPTGEIMYYVAAVAVLYDRDEDAQRHYIGHTEDIQCMDLHPSRDMVASGQRAGRTRKTQAHIRIWSTESLLTLYVFGMGEFEVGVSAVAFSQLNGGSYVLAVDDGRERILSVWQWQWGHLLGKVATLQQDEMTGAAFHPLDDNLMITHGKGHLTFWTRRKDGFFERTDIIKPPSRTTVTSLQFEQDGDVVTADSDGFITIYSVDSDGAYFVRMEFEAHNKSISSLIMLSEGTLLSGGEKDRKIIAWDSLQNYKKVTESKLNEAFGGVRTIYPQRPGRNDGNIYVGTVKNNILEGSLQRRFNQIIFGHTKQLLGLAVHPDDELFATAGHDKTVALWRRQKLLWNIQLMYECVSLCFHPFGVALAVGSTEGYLVILNAETGAIVTTVRVCGSPLNCVGYNPAGDMIAIGSQNGSIYLFRVSRDGFTCKKLSKIRGAQPLVQLDWSCDNNFVQTVTGDYDIAYWDVKGALQEKSHISMKDIKWSTVNSTVGYLISGIWNNRFYPMTSMITTVNRSAAYDLLVVGDSDGYLRLFRYPCISSKAEYNEEKVYGGTITCARFLYNDRNLVTVGGIDASLMLWDVVDE
ncbi:hypothetical protein V9T40_011253 [Parthenolecanium corni]|uniref:Doublecortin domain-containing protein n=1 Tax=Parthenolecanium corni TaxID=536013 RepID=A0AAN9XY86_9HEMI